MFKAIIIEQAADPAEKGEQAMAAPARARLAELEDDRLPEGDVTVRVEYSTINYKDALAITGTGPVVRRYPMVPGIDFAGTVETSSNPAFEPGAKVLLNGHGVGEAHWGGLAGKARVKGEWLLPLPAALSPRDAMALGTAGYTAMLCVQALERHGVTPEKGEVLVSGANGGVGSVSIAVLARLGYTVVASTGRAELGDRLKKLGAAEVIDRASLAGPGKPLARERWAGAIDSVGSHTLANICASTRYGGAVAACGLAQGMDFPGTVAPFILRGVSLIGIDSVYAPRSVREAAWQRLPTLIGPDFLEHSVVEIPLADAIEAARNLLDGKVSGRIVVDTRR